MWNIFRKSKSTNDKLFEYEKQILNIETQLIDLRQYQFSFKFLGGSIIIIILFIYSGLSLFLSIIISLLIYTVFHIFKVKYRKNYIRLLEYKLKKLKEEQLDCIKNAKEDINFMNTRRLIEKYEIEEDKKAYFSTIINKKRTNLNKLADMILANDPDKMNALICKYCGQHNGLIDPNNSDIKYFYCYSCKQKNDRKHKTQQHLKTISNSNESNFN